MHLKKVKHLFAFKWVKYVFDPLSISKISGSQVSFLQLTSWDWACYLYERLLSPEAINQSDSELSTMAKTKELSKDVRDTIVDLHKAGMAYKPSPSSLVRRWQQLVRIFKNGRRQQITVNLPQTGASCKIHLVEFQWSWERWGISPELHGRILSMISRQLGP